MSIPLKDIDQSEAYGPMTFLPLGWNDVMIAEVYEIEDRNGDPMLELRFESTQGDLTIKQSAKPEAYGFVLALLESVGVEVQGGEWAFDAVGMLKGKRLSVFVVEKPNYNDPNKYHREVQAYDKPGRGGNGHQPGAEVPADTTGFRPQSAQGKDEDIPF